MVSGTDAIRWWDDELGEWALLGTAAGTDYTLEYLLEGDLAGYTLLTVSAPGPVPEPALSAMFLGLAAAVMLVRKRRET